MSQAQQNHRWVPVRAGLLISSWAMCSTGKSHPQGRAVPALPLAAPTAAAVRSSECSWRIPLFWVQRLFKVPFQTHPGDTTEHQHSCHSLIAVKQCGALSWATPTTGQPAGTAPVDRWLWTIIFSLFPQNAFPQKSTTATEFTVQESEAPNNLTAKPLPTPNLGLPHTDSSVFSASKICFPKCRVCLQTQPCSRVRASQLCHRFVMKLPKYFPIWSS